MSTTLNQSKIIPNDFFENQDINLNNLGNDFVKNYFMKKDRNGIDTIIISTSQIRKFLSSINSVQNKTNVLDKKDKDFDKKWKELWQEIQYLRIKLAYQAGRADKDKAIALKHMQKEFDPIIEKINSKEKFNKFARLMESIVAYHKFNGGN